MLMQEKPSILFLQETKCSSTILEKIAVKAWPGGLVTAVDAQGASGGLAILWDVRAIQLNNIQANKSFIQATFHLSGTNTYGLITNVYFPQDTAQKAQILNTLSELNTDRPYPLWVSGGDYNMTTNMEEKQGSRSRANSDGNLLKNFIHNNWPGNNLKRPFRFEEFWLTHPDFEELVRSTWLNFNPTEGTRMSRFQQKLKHLKGAIKRWNHNTFGNIFKAQATPNLEMKKIQQTIITEGRTEELTKQEQDIESRILERAKQEETLWRQKSRIRWLKNGEKNTKFFHKTTVQRRMINYITHIKNEQGDQIETHEGIEEEFLNYFKKAHQEPNINRMSAINKLLKNIPRIITEEHNSLLIKPISLQ
eukprot:PITA_04448